MENASKALIIAGAILLAILLISLGIMIFNQAQDTVNNSGMSQAEISAFNNQFLKYEGTQKGSVVKSLVSEALANNVGVDLDKAGVDYTSGIDTSKTYTVTLDYSNEGKVNNINITTVK